jgi:hypothetical protein
MMEEPEVRAAEPQRTAGILGRGGQAGDGAAESGC